jgi:hypothetical protein
MTIHYRKPYYSRYHALCGCSVVPADTTTDTDKVRCKRCRKMVHKRIAQKGKLW